MPLQIPDPPLLVAGGLGGPLIMWTVTPLRNALTLGANNRQASMLQLYRQVFASKPYGGGGYMAAAACPGFLVVGPMYHVYNGFIGNSAAACVLTATNEALIFCGSETKNAQVAIIFSSSLSLLSFSSLSPVHFPVLLLSILPLLLFSSLLSPACSNYGKKKKKPFPMEKKSL